MQNGGAHLRRVLIVLWIAGSQPNSPGNDQINMWGRTGWWQRSLIANPTLAMYSVTMYRLPFSSTITPSSWTRLSCRSCLQQMMIRQTWILCLRVCQTQMMPSVLRHDRGLGDKGLRCGVVFYALHSHFGASVIPDHDIWNHNQWPC